MSKLIKNGYTILENMYTEDDIEKLISNTSEFYLKSRFDFEFDDGTKLSSDINTNFSLSEILINMEKKINTFQMFWQSNSNINLKNNFKQVSEKILKIYNIKSFRENSNLQTYLPDSFIKSHDDGIVKNRFAVALTPFNTKPEGGVGGDLILELKDNTKLILENKVGNVILLDFTKNNLKHEVTKIKNWSRVVLVSFLFFE